MDGVKLALILGFLFFTLAKAEECNVLPIKHGDPCVFIDDEDITRTIDSDDEEMCLKHNDSCCWDGSACHNRMDGSGEKPKSGKRNPFKIPRQKDLKASVNQRSLAFGGVPFPCLKTPPFPSSCKFQRNEPFVLYPPTNVPYCVRIACSLDRVEQSKLDTDHFLCGSKPGCYFDPELSEYRQAFGPSVLPGVPVCHFAIRNAAFHKQAQKVISSTGSWNPFYTNCLLNTFEDEIAKGPPGCKLLPLLRAFKIYPKLAGWEGITSKECYYIDACWSPVYGCTYPVDIANIVVKSGQKFRFDRHEVIYGRPKCQHFSMKNSYEILKSYHRCLSSGCSIDLSIVSKYYHYLYDIGYQMTPEDHWDFWGKATGGQFTPDKLDEGIHWEWDREFNNKLPGVPSSPSFPPPPNIPNIPNPAMPFSMPGQRSGFQVPRFPSLQPPPPPQQCGFVFRPSGGRPCQPPQVPDFQQNDYCPYKPFSVPRFKRLRGSFKGCCDINYCYLSIRDIRKMHSGPSPYYTEWSAFSACSQTCRGGTQKRTRFCVSHDKSKCTLKREETRSCSTQDCPEWSSWGPWTPCPGQCGIQQRRRRCSPSSDKCIGNAEEVKRCNCFGG